MDEVKKAEDVDDNNENETDLKKESPSKKVKEQNDNTVNAGDNEKLAVGAGNNVQFAEGADDNEKLPVGADGNNGKTPVDADDNDKPAVGAEDNGKQDVGAEDNDEGEHEEKPEKVEDQKEADAEEVEDMEEVDESIYTKKYDGKTSQIPDFAVVYSFLELFGVYLGLPAVTITDLEQSIDTTTNLCKKDDPGILELLLMKLFRRLNKSSRFASLASCQHERLSKVVLKFTLMTDMSCSWDLEQFGYHILSSAQKLLILKNLCEVQFDENIKFRNSVQEEYKSDQGALMRLVPYGYEQEGLNVWFHEDKEYNLRVYAGEEDDASGDSWKIRAGSVEDLQEYISQLKSQTEVNPKDVAAEKIKERKIARQEEREHRRREREEKRKAEEEKQAKKKSTRRRAKPKKEDLVESDSSEEEDDGCARCYENKQSELVLLCDGCDAAYHTLCLRPPVIDIPEGDWFCPFCLQLQLIEKLQKKYDELRKKLSAKERQSRRLDFYGIRSTNILQEVNDNGLGTRRAAKRVDYNFSDYDRMISDAMKSYGGSKNGTAKVKTTSSDSDQATRRSQRDSKQAGRRKLNNLSSDEDASSGSEFAFSESDFEGRGRSDMRDFVVDDDVDEMEEKYKNKYLRRSKRNRDKNPRSIRKRYRDGEETQSDSSDDDGPRRSKRKTRHRNPAVYTENFSDEEQEEETVPKTKGSDANVKDGDDWVNSAGEEPNEDGDEFEVNSGDDESDSLSTPHRNKRPEVPRKKLKKIIESDEDDLDEEVPYEDESEPEIEEEEEEDEEEEEEEEEDEEKSEEESETPPVKKQPDDDRKTDRKTDQQQELNRETVGRSDSCESATDKKFDEIVAAGKIDTPAVEEVKTVQTLPEVIENKNSNGNEIKDGPKISGEKRVASNFNTVDNNSIGKIPPLERIIPQIKPVQIHQPVSLHSPTSNARVFNNHPRFQNGPGTNFGPTAWNSGPRTMNDKAYTQEMSAMHSHVNSTYPSVAASSYYNQTSTARQYEAPGMLHQSRPDYGMPMRPTPTYGYRQRLPPYAPYGMQRHPNEMYQRPQSVPTNRFYRGAAPSWPTNPHQHGFSQPPYAESVTNAVDTYQLEKEKTYKKNLYEQEKRDKKAQRRDKSEKHRQTVAPSVYQEPPSAKGIGFFKNMVITPDGSPNSSASYPPFSPARM